MSLRPPCGECGVGNQENGDFVSQLFLLSDYMSDRFLKTGGNDTLLSSNDDIDYKRPPDLSRMIKQSPSDFVERIYKHDPSAEDTEFGDRQMNAPWIKYPYYFRTVHISLIAMMKMMIHSISGGSMEIMGMLLGHRVDDHLVILDCYQLPVQGTESRVNPQNDSYEFMLKYLDDLKIDFKLKKENIIGWYHSHPGFGCWLSGIDVQTQKLHQGFEDPYVAIVIDPIKSMRFGNIDIGAFRTFNDNHRPTNTDEKNGTLGWHCKEYYALDIQLFCNEHDKIMLRKMDDLLQSEDLKNGNAENDNFEDLFSDLLRETSKIGFDERMLDRSMSLDDDYDAIKLWRSVNSMLESIEFSEQLRKRSRQPSLNKQKTRSSNNTKTSVIDADTSLNEASSIAVSGTISAQFDGHHNKIQKRSDVPLKPLVDGNLKTRLVKTGLEMDNVAISKLNSNILISKQRDLIFPKK